MLRDERALLTSHVPSPRKTSNAKNAPLARWSPCRPLAAEITSTKKAASTILTPYPSLPIYAADETEQ